MTLLLYEAKVRKLLPIPVTFEAVEDAFGLLGRGEATNCPLRRGKA